MSSLTLFTPAGVLLKSAPLKLAARRLKAMGYEVSIDEAALAKTPLRSRGARAASWVILAIIFDRAGCGFGVCRGRRCGGRRLVAL